MDPTAEDSWRLEWGDRVYFSHAMVRQAGVATLFSPDLQPEVLGVAEAMPGRLLHLRVRMEGLVVNLVNVYAPTSGPEQLQYYQRASAFLGALDSHECLVQGGDFNTTLEEQDRSGTEQSPAAVDTLREIVEAHQSSHSQLERIYLSSFHLSRAHSSSIRLAPFSDHYLATVTASLCAERPGPAYWHFNNSLLEDEGFVTSFRKFWLAWRGQRHAFPSARRWWDLGKVRARLFCRNYTRGTSQQRNAVIEQLEREVLELERHLAASPKDPLLCGVCREKREVLQALEDHWVRGAFVRSRNPLLREMDRGSCFFYALEKTRGAKKQVTCLLAKDSTPLPELMEMCGRARAFYTSLFSPDPTDPGACRVLWKELPTVSASDRDQLELPLTLAEFPEALRRMPTNMSPGMDGLTVEFYHVLGRPRPRPSHRLGRVFAERGPPSFVQASRAHLIAEGGPPRFTKLASHLAPQHGLQNRSKNQEKAFNRVDHAYLLNTLRAFGFAPQFVGFLQVLYASAECLVKLNWTLTEPVSFGRGVWQECPLSGQLYALAIEPFLCLLRRRFSGLVLREPKLWLVLSVYANDVLLVVQNSDDLAQVEACQAIYSAASSARVNWVKSSGLAVGDWRQASSLPPVLQTIRWSAGPLLYLGVYRSAMHPSPPENWENLEGGVIDWLWKWTGLL
ncbi:unnamed protein product [Caretta caretta]